MDARVAHASENYFKDLRRLLAVVRESTGVSDLPSGIGRTSWLYAPETLRPDNEALPGNGDFRVTSNPIHQDRTFPTDSEFLNTGIERGRSRYQGIHLWCDQRSNCLGTSLITIVNGRRVTTYLSQTIFIFLTVKQENSYWGLESRAPY